MKNRIYERKSKHSLLGIIMTLSFLVLGGNSFAQEQEIDVTPEELKLEKDYTPYAGNSYPNKV